MKISKGFTLIEISIVLILIGMIAMMGMHAFVGIIREDKNLAQKKENDNIVRSMLYYAQAQGTLPSLTQFMSAISNKRDNFGNLYTYMPANKLDNQTICSFADATDFSIRFCRNDICTDNDTVDNVSFVFLSNGMNGQPDAVQQLTPQMLSIYMGNQNNDDIPVYYTLLELKAAAKCGIAHNQQTVRFATSTLPPVNKKNAHIADSGLLAAAGNGEVFKWCVTNFNDIANFSDSNKIRMKSGTQTMYFRSNCTDRTNFDVGTKYFNITYNATAVDLTDKDPKIASFDVYVIDNKSISPVKETFLYQLFYNP